jgi:hypothetical protein
LGRDLLDLLARRFDERFQFRQLVPLKKALGLTDKADNIDFGNLRGAH